jgi:hypothetical protein
MNNLLHLIANIIAAIFGGGPGVNSGKPEINLNRKEHPHG